jgi:ABC-type lipoprotein release transport system permease subunit
MNPTFWIKTALLFLFRSKRTTLALGLMIFFAVATLVFISSIAVGINDSMILNSTGLYSGQITGTHLPDTVTRQTLFVDGVSNVLQRFKIPGILHYQGKKEMLTLIAVNPGQELKSTSLWKKIIKGKYIKDNTFEILISHDTAKQLAIDLGDKVIFNSGSSVYPLIVAGIYKTGINRFDRGIAFSPVSILPDHLRNWDCAIFLNPGVDMTTIIASYAQKSFNSSILKTWKDQMPDLTQLIELNRISMGFVMVLVLGVVSFGTACAFVIFIISNIREYGIMKAMGVTPSETAMLIFSEVMLLNIMASLAGTLAGFTAVLISSKTGIDLSSFTSHNQYFVVSGLIIPRLTPFLLFLPSFLTIVFCLLAAVWPAMIVKRQRSSDILRSI